MLMRLIDDDDGCRLSDARTDSPRRTRRFRTEAIDLRSRKSRRADAERRRMAQGQGLKSKAKRASGRSASAGKKTPTAANRHGKVIKQRKGKFLKPPKRGGANASASAVSVYEQNARITKEVNAKNELEFSRLATSSGGTFRLLQAPEGVELDPSRQGPKPKKRKTVVKTPAQLQAEKKAAKWSY